MIKFMLRRMKTDKPGLEFNNFTSMPVFLFSYMDGCLPAKSLGCLQYQVFCTVFISLDPSIVLFLQLTSSFSLQISCSAKRRLDLLIARVICAAHIEILSPIIHLSVYSIK